jgi:S1-C subfamily serine protease
LQRRTIHRADRHDAISPVALFKTLAPSIFIVDAIRNSGDEFQGSAVAVSSKVLLTNCHVVADSSSITLTQKNIKLKATLISADVDADRCILQSEQPLATYTPIRPYDDLSIDERVYSIGAPAGLELTMSDGLISGKRTLAGRRLIQTTAPISPGSSGGGLFDEAGNLVGITTFRLKDSENLNFAISAEDYLNR